MTTPVMSTSALYNWCTCGVAGSLTRFVSPAESRAVPVSYMRVAVRILNELRRARARRMRARGDGRTDARAPSSSARARGARARAPLGTRTAAELEDLTPSRAVGSP